MAGTRSGFNAKTRQELAQAGTLRKDRHGDLKSPEPSAGRPDPPGELPKVAQEEWNRMLWALEDMGALHKVDAFSVYQYVQLYAETEAVSVRQVNLESAVERLEENLPDFKGEEFLKLCQELTTMHKLVAKCTDQLRSGRMAIRQYLVEFGLTPASRGRIKLPSKQDETDEFTAFQQLQRVK